MMMRRVLYFYLLFLDFRIWEGVVFTVGGVFDLAEGTKCCEYLFHGGVGVKAPS